MYRAKKNVCLFPIIRPSPFFAADPKVFFFSFLLFPYKIFLQNKNIFQPTYPI